MKKLLFLSLIVFTVILISCNKDEDEKVKTNIVKYSVTCTKPGITIHYSTDSSWSGTGTPNSSWSFERKAKSGDEVWVFAQSGEINTTLKISIVFNDEKVKDTTIVSATAYASGKITAILP